MTRVLGFDVYHISFLMLIIVVLRGIESHMLLECYKAHTQHNGDVRPPSCQGAYGRFCSPTVQERSENVLH